MLGVLVGVFMFGIVQLYVLMLVFLQKCFDYVEKCCLLTNTIATTC